MITVDNILVDEKIFTTKFSCDYEVCKGACCNKPVSGIELIGGALSDSDAAEILYHREDISLLCDKEDQPIVSKQPVFKFDGYFYTTLHRSKCALCNMEKGTCALKIAKNLKVADIDIPLSCQLYPILWQVDENKVDTLTIGDIFDDYCKYGYEKGERDNIYLIDFLKVPLIRGLGESFYSKLKEVQKRFI